MSPASASRFFTTELPEKPLKIIFFLKYITVKKTTVVFFSTLLMILEYILCGIRKLFILSIKFLMIF